MNKYKKKKMKWHKRYIFLNATSSGIMTQKHGSIH